MYTSTIIRNGLLSTFVAASLLASMGLCWHEHWDCLQGKWIACTIVLCGAFIVLLKGRVQKDKFLYLLFATLIGCQISDILANSISIANLLWGLALLSFVSLCKEITNKSWLFIVAICNLLILTMSILQYAIVSIPFSLQILDNPAGNASALVMGICCILPHDFSIRHFSNRWFSVVIVILLSCVVILSGALLYNCSRTGFVALFLSFSIYLVSFFKNKLSRKHWILVAIASSIVLFLLISQLYLRNPYSVEGRFLTYHVSAQMITIHPWLGWGSNAINAHYMASQANYLQTLSPNHIYHTLAGDVVRPFNEILNGLMQYGIVNILLFLIVFLYIWKRITSTQRMELLPILTAWIALGMSSYPSYYPYACLLLAGSFGNVLHAEEQTSHTRVKEISSTKCKRYMIFTILLLSTYAAAVQWYKEYTKETWLDNDAAEINSASDANTATLPSIISDDIDVLYALSVDLNLEGKPQRSQAVLAKLRGRLQNYDTELIAGDNALSLQQWHDAEKHFQLAHAMIPVRFMPLFGQMQVYSLSGDSVKARNVALKIIRKKVKVDSDDIHDIKAKALKILKARE